MIRFLAKRIAFMVPVLLLVSFVVFLLVELVPGNPAITLAGGQNATPQEIATITAQLHLNEPVLVQYWHWLSGVLQLNLGQSVISGQSVATGIGSRLPVSLSLVLAAVVFALVVGVFLGVVSALRPRSAVDTTARLTSSAALAIPNFWLAVELVALLSVHWKIFPPTGFTPISQSFTGWLRTVTLPAIALGSGLAAVVARQLRVSLVEALESGYVRTAWAKGAGPMRVVFLHAMKNAASPTITILGFTIGYLLGGTVIIEQIFSIPGLGEYMLQAITNHDLPIVQGVVLVFVIFQMVMSLLVDISYGYLNPKVRIS
jgi:peptide/nickel transport system permease protein